MLTAVTPFRQEAALAVLERATDSSSINPTFYVVRSCRGWRKKRLCCVISLMFRQLPQSNHLIKYKVEGAICQCSQESSQIVLKPEKTVILLVFLLAKQGLKSAMSILHCVQKPWSFMYGESMHISSFDVHPIDSIKEGATHT